VTKYKKPNKALKDAMKDYTDFISENDWTSGQKTCKEGVWLWERIVESLSSESSRARC
jgi:hypothetical protein